jgi:hypothetical protein
LYNSGDRVQVHLRQAGSSYQLQTRLRDDNGAYPSTGYYSISPDEHYVEVLVEYASSSSANNGALTLWIDGILVARKASIDLYYRGKPNRIQFGAISGIDSGTRGSLYLDEFVLRDDGTEIGPVGSTAASPAPMPEGEAQEGRRSILNRWLRRVRSLADLIDTQELGALLRPFLSTR